jgi:hypothetical protein
MGCPSQPWSALRHSAGATVTAWRIASTVRSGPSWHVMAHADWLIDMGPGAGHDGGRVVFTGTPGALVAHGDSLTAEHLRGYLAAADRS